jgi:hypothetical protein
MTNITEIVLVTGDRIRVEGHAKDVERAILDAARGSIPELAWIVDSETEDAIAINPECVVMLRELGPKNSGRA